MRRVGARWAVPPQVPIARRDFRLDSLTLYLFITSQIGMERDERWFPIGFSWALTGSFLLGALDLI